MSRLTALALAAVVASGSVALAQPKKAPQDRFTKAASDAFKAALAADQANDLATALGLYQKAFAISPHPSTAYNIADVYRRQGKLTAAIEFYEVFLVLSPSPLDSKEVEALIAKLEATPSVLTLTSPPPSDATSVDLASAYVLVDGVLVKRAGEPAGFDPRTNAPQVMLSVPSGDQQQIDVVTPLSYGSVKCRLPPGEKADCEIRMQPRIDGNLVFNSNSERHDFELRLPTKKIDRDRALAPAGKQRLSLRDRDIECGTITVDVPKGPPNGTDVAYIFVHGTESSFRMHCRPYKVVQHRLTFAP